MMRRTTFVPTSAVADAMALAQKAIDDAGRSATSVGALQSTATGAISQSVQDRANLWAAVKGLAERVDQLDLKPGPKGDAGPAVELRNSGSAIEWRVPGGSWVSLVALSAITGPAGSAALASTARFVTLSLPLIAAAVTLDVPVTWSEPMPGPLYRIEPAPGAGLVDKVSVSVKSRTMAGCVLSVRTSSVVVAGGLLNVLAVG